MVDGTAATTDHDVCICSDATSLVITVAVCVKAANSDGPALCLHDVSDIPLVVDAKGLDQCIKGVPSSQKIASNRKTSNATYDA